MSWAVQRRAIHQQNATKTRKTPHAPGWLWARLDSSETRARSATRAAGGAALGARQEAAQPRGARAHSSSGKLPAGRGEHGTARARRRSGRARGEMCAEQCACASGAVCARARSSPVPARGGRRKPSSTGWHGPKDDVSRRMMRESRGSCLCVSRSLPPALSTRARIRLATRGRGSTLWGLLSPPATRAAAAHATFGIA